MFEFLIHVLCKNRQEGFNPIRLYADTENRRAWPGGMGFAKAGGNYAPTILPQVEAQEQHGCAQARKREGREMCRGFLLLLFRFCVSVFHAFARDSALGQFCLLGVGGLVVVVVVSVSLLGVIVGVEFDVLERC